MPRSIEDASKKAGDMIHVSPAGAWAVMRRKGNFGSLACIEFVFPWHCNPRGVLLLGSTGNTCVTHTCLAQGKGAPLSRGCCRLPLGNFTFIASTSISSCLLSVEEGPAGAEEFQRGAGTGGAGGRGADLPRAGEGAASEGSAHWPKLARHVYVCMYMSL